MAAHIFLANVLAAALVVAAIVAAVWYVRVGRHLVKPRRPLPRNCPDFFAVVVDGERLSYFSTDLEQARSVAARRAAEGQLAELVRCRVARVTWNWTEGED